MKTGYKEMAQKLFVSKIKNDFPDWECYKADITSGKITLSFNSIEVALVYDEESDKYYPLSIEKHGEYNVSWDKSDLDDLRNLLGVILPDNKEFDEDEEGDDAPNIPNLE